MVSLSKRPEIAIRARLEPRAGAVANKRSDRFPT